MYKDAFILLWFNIFPSHFSLGNKEKDPSMWSNKGKTLKQQQQQKPQTKQNPTPKPSTKPETRNTPEHFQGKYSTFLYFQGSLGEEIAYAENNSFS